MPRRAGWSIDFHTDAVPLVRPEVWSKVGREHEFGFLNMDLSTNNALSSIMSQPTICQYVQHELCEAVKGDKAEQFTVVCCQCVTNFTNANSER